MRVIRQIREEQFHEINKSILGKTSYDAGDFFRTTDVISRNAGEIQLGAAVAEKRIDTVHETLSVYAQQDKLARSFFPSSMNFQTKQDPAALSLFFPRGGNAAMKAVNKLGISGVRMRGRARLRRRRLRTETAWLYHPSIDLSPDFSSRHGESRCFLPRHAERAGGGFPDVEIPDGHYNSGISDRKITTNSKRQNLPPNELAKSLSSSRRLPMAIDFFSIAR